MATVSNTNTNNGIPTALLEGSTAVSKNATSETSDRFLKLLVTQMKNQDPLNPVDFAQQEAFLKGKIELLSYLIENSQAVAVEAKDDAIEAQYNQSHQQY